MSSTLETIIEKFNLRINQKSPIAIPNFGRVQLADLIHELDFKVGVEVGVAAGWYSSVLMRVNPQMTLYGVDPWEGQPGYRDYTRPKTFTTLKENAESRLKDYPNYHFKQMTSMEALKDFENNSLDFVYIDADHSFLRVTEDVDGWLKKVKPGGILAGHDYAHTRGNARMHVKRVLPAYMTAWGLKPWFVLGNEANNEGLIRDASRSWMYVKP